MVKKKDKKEKIVRKIEDISIENIVPDKFHAVIFIRYKTEKYEEFVKYCLDHPFILDFYRLTGEYDGLIEVEAESTDDLYQVRNYLTKFEGLQDLNTHIILKEWIK
ncbi:MAG: Lrp/AsnC ligand binding domain-containing protein [Promethearchaeota archaeon]